MGSSGTAFLEYTPATCLQEQNGLGYPKLYFKKSEIGLNTPTKGQGPALPTPSSLPTLGSSRVGSEGKRKFYTAQYLVSQFSAPLLQYLYHRRLRHLVEMGWGLWEQRGRGTL